MEYEGGEGSRGQDMRSLGLLNPEKKDAEERALSKMYLNVFT